MDHHPAPRSVVGRRLVAIPLSREMSAAISFSGLTATKILAHGHENSGLVATRIPV
jgi:hypothetical protein